MTNSSPLKITMLLIGKPSISMGHLYDCYSYVSHNQRVSGSHDQPVITGPSVSIAEWLNGAGPGKFHKTDHLLGVLSCHMEVS